MDQKNIQTAIANARNLPISTKHSIEISNFLRYKNTVDAKVLLDGVVAKKVPVPFNRFNRDIGHKKGIGPGRFPQKAAKEFLSLLKNVEANAQSKGLDASSLKIIKILANKASIPMGGGRNRYATKRTHLEIEVKEVKKKEKKSPAKKTEDKGNKK